MAILSIAWRREEHIVSIAIVSIAIVSTAMVSIAMVSIAMVSIAMVSTAIVSRHRSATRRGPEGPCSVPR